MRKKVQTLLAVTLLLALLFSATAYAAPGGESLAQRIDTTNDYVSISIGNAIELADQALTVCMTKIDVVLHQVELGVLTEDEALALISGIEEDYRARLDAIASTLIANTDRRVLLLIVAGDRYDVEIISEYVEVQLGDQTYLVDPLRIVGN